MKALSSRKIYSVQHCLTAQTSYGRKTNRTIKIKILYAFQDIFCAKSVKKKIRKKSVIEEVIRRKNCDYDDEHEHEHDG